MKHLFSGLTAMALSLSALAQPNCSEIIQASFTYTVQGSVVVATNTSQSMFPQATTYQWNFGDGEVMNGSVVTHVYDAPGTYLLCLYAVVENCVDSTCQEIVIGGGSSPCDDLNAEFTYTAVGPEVSFDNVATSNLFAYQWYFGDGTTGGGQDPTHTYPEPGTYAACLVLWTWDPEIQDSCFAENCEIVVVEGDEQPCDGLAADFVAIVQGDEAWFSNTTSGTGFQTTWSWSFGDGSTSTNPQPHHQYDGPGDYLVCLTAISIYEQNGGVITCVDSVCHEVSIQGGGSPCDSLNADFTVAVQGNVAFVNNALSSNNYSYSWSFGDGTSGAGPDPVHTYGAPGTYHICLLMWSWNPNTQDTCYADHCEWVVVGNGDPCDSLQSCFQWGVQATTATFYNCTNLMGQGLLFEWHFGDGTSSTAIDPTHTYSAPGTYTVCLTSWLPNSPDSCTSTICNTVVIEGGSSPCDSLSAAFWYGSNGGDPNSIFFSASQPGGPGIHWLWSFGDGTYSDDGPQGTHTYGEAGTYELCLTVWQWIAGSQDTCSTTSCQSVVVGGGPCDSLQSCFQWGVQANTATFYNCTNLIGQGLSFEWNFGDGTSSTAIDPAHTYSAPGAYTVCLTSWLPNSPDSCTSTICNTVVIQGESSPCDSLSAYFNVTVQGNLAAFTTFGGTAMGYHWTFGDGTFGDSPGPMHTYPGPGTYHACLVTWTWNPLTQDTCYADHCEWITIGEANPCDSLYACFQWAGQGTLQFYNCSYGGNDLNYWWSFGDGTNSDDYQPSHTFPGPGTYIVCLTVSVPNSPDSCSDTVCNTIVVQGGGSPCDSLSANFVVTTQENVAAFTSFGGTAMGYHWIFGDGTNGDGPNPVHTYPEPGTYHACLVTWTWNPLTQDTCYAEHCEWITLGGNSPCDSLYACFQWGTQEQSLQFYNCSSFNGNELSYWWSFGDGTYSDAYQPSHTYPGPGSYTVCLTAYGGNGQDSCSNTTCNTVVIQGEGSPCDSLSADFTVTGIETQAVFTGFGGTAIGYHWIFGDGTEGDGSNAVHTYPGPGTYHACLITWTWDPQTQDTCYAEHCEWITLGQGTPCDSLYACFQWEGQQNVVPFYNCSYGGGNELDYWWSFGDGTYSDAYQPTHTFPGPGTYTVCLTVSAINSPDSCSDTTCNTVVIEGDDPCAELEAGFTVNVGDVTVFFTNTTTGTGFGTTWYWTFGDGSTSAEEDPSHIYPNLGTYEACLVVTTMYEIPGQGVITCQDSTCQTVFTGIGSPCDGLNAEFSATITGLMGMFQAGANPPGTTYEWHFGDGSSGDGANTMHMYTGPGIYNVCLIVGNYDPVTQDSCFEDHCQMFTIGGGSPCDSLWEAEFEYGAQGNVYTFYNTSNTQGTMVSTTWDFGDGTTGDGSQLVHTYVQGGEYIVCMTITGIAPGTDDTCQVTTCQMIDVALGIGDMAGVAPINAWPQPFDVLLQVEGAGLQGLTRFTLHDMTGRTVADHSTVTQGRITLNYEQLPPGTYVLHMHNALTDRSIRVMKR